MRIDSHQHYWRPARADYGWLTPDRGLLYRDYLPADLRPDLDAAGIDATIVVQAAPTIAETEFMLSLAGGESRIAGVVGWLDFEAEDFEANLLRLKANPLFVGVRPMIQEIADDRWMLRPRVVESLRLLARHDFPLDFLVFPRHLPIVAAALALVPGLRGVIDHIAKPDIAGGVLDPWRDDLRAVAAHPGMHCKLSGMVTEADHANWKIDDFREAVEFVFDLFGPQRLMFGSDWPVCLLAATYRQTVDVLEQCLPARLDAADRAAIWGGTAAAFYRLPHPSDRAKAFGAWKQCKLDGPATVRQLRDELQQ